MLLDLVFEDLFYLGSAQEFVKVCNWRGFQNAGLSAFRGRLAIMGRWCDGFIRRWSRTEISQGFFPWRSQPPNRWEEDRKALIHLGMSWGMPTTRSRNWKLCGYSQCLGQTGSRFWEGLFVLGEPLLAYLSRDRAPKPLAAKVGRQNYHKRP